MVAAVVARPDQSVTVHCGDRTMTLSWKDLQDFVGARGQRGAVLSRNYRKVTRLTVE
jgi:topoisomerase-4 subunit A